MLEGWARDGLTDEQIAYNMGVSRSTLGEWKRKYQVLSDTLKKGKEVVDRQVENALLKRALGYSYQEVKKEEWKDNDGNPVQKVTTTEKAVIPDTTAQIFWLKNRRPDKWRDKQNLELVTKEQEARIAQMKAQTDKIVRESGDSEEDGVEIINDAPKETG